MRQKIRHLRLEVVGAKGYMSTTSIAMPKELPKHLQVSILALLKLGVFHCYGCFCCYGEGACA